MKDERGAGSILVVTIVGLLLFAAMGAATAVRIYVVHSRVSSAADLTALAAARSASCDEGRRVARANEVELRSCEQDGTDFQVVTGSDVVLFGQTYPVEVAARAGY
ncbi:MAG: Rv3654c family TadE-like protein [Candidatus Nanopelagicales bacterium]